MDNGEALARAGRGAALSHESAAAVWSMELLDPAPQRLTVPRNRSRLLLPGWEVVRSRVSDSDVEEVGGLRVTTPLRTVSDLARSLPQAQAVVAADSALRLRLVTLEALLAVLAPAFGRGSDRVRRVATLVDPLSGSVLESVLRVLLRTRAPGGQSQYIVRNRFGHFVARVDLCWPHARLIVEADGYEFHKDRAQYRRDRERLNELELLGWRVLRFTWEDVMGRPDHVVAMVSECLRSVAA